MVDLASTSADQSQSALLEQYCRVVVESSGISNPADALVEILSSELEFRLRELVQGAAKFTRRSKRRKMTGADVDAALRLVNVEPVYGFTCPDGLPFRLAGSGGRDQIYFIEEKELDLGTVVNVNVPKVPLDVQLKSHWLAIDGVQPAVAENPQVQTADASAAAAADGEASQRLRASELVNARSVITHDVPLELQVFYKEITEACIGADEGRRSDALQSLAHDTGIQSIVPRFSVFLAEGVRCNAIQHNLALLIYLMRVVKSMADNPAVNLDKCLHDLVPAILTCALSRKLCARPEQDNHWALRDFASRLLVSLLGRCDSSVAGLSSRVVEMTARVWRGGQSSMAMLYGALHILTEMGMDTVKNFVVPRVPIVSERLRGAATESYAERAAADMCQKLLLKTLIGYVKHCRPPNLKDMQDYREKFGGLGASVYQQVTSVGAPPPSSGGGGGGSGGVGTVQRFSVSTGGQRLSAGGGGGGGGASAYSRLLGTNRPTQGARPMGQQQTRPMIVQRGMGGRPAPLVISHQTVSSSRPPSAAALSPALTRPTPTSSRGSHDDAFS